MKTRFILLGSMVMMLASIAATPASSQVNVELGVRFGPPPPRYEVMAAPPYAHAVWVRGHWAWNPRADRYMWSRGYWVPERQAYGWVDGGWYRGPRGWFWREGSWQHGRVDRDRHEYRHDDGRGYRNDGRQYYNDNPQYQHDNRGGNGHRR